MLPEGRLSIAVGVEVEVGGVLPADALPTPPPVAAEV